MEDLKLYVDKLFINYGYSTEIKELKEEILSNLVAKRADLMANGLDDETASIQAKESITSIDSLIDSNLNVYKQQFKFEILQRGLIYFIIAWIIVIPCSISTTGIIINQLLLWSIFIAGLFYLVARSKKDPANYNNTSYISLSKLKKISKYGWVIWSVFIGLSMFRTTGLHFASNIWFHRNIVIDGPYQLVSIIMEYTVPLVTIVIPLLLQSLPRIAMKYEVKEHD